ncbi:MAG: enolase C-terminal domain-like protein [Tepidisphaeraceae bacterium]
MRNCILAQVVEAEVTFVEQPFAMPLVLSSGAISVITQATARVRVQVGDREADGYGCVYLSDLWAWPEPELTHAERDAAMRAFCTTLARQLPTILHTSAHPLELGMTLHAHLENSPDPNRLPLLARIISASPFDAAIHDAVGIAMDRNALRLYDDVQPMPALDGLFDGKPGAACAAIRRVLANPPRRSCAGWWIVGKNDDLSRDVGPALKDHGYYTFKIKTQGKSAREDARRVVDIYRFAKSTGHRSPRLSIDSNCGNPDAASVAEFLESVLALDGDAYDAIEVLEQPTARDIAGHAFNWRPLTKMKSVVVDEGLTGVESMRLACEQGWSGYAIKTCKGHSFTLVCTAWAKAHGMDVVLMDLTNPNLSAIHSALLAATLPTSNGIELNSVQFTPDANASCREALPGLFDVRDGEHALPSADVVGLGSGLCGNK